jgi:3-hydroxy acid dehydrogenase / malonic semialdehyde reductase
MNMKNLKNQIVCITGASSGIGRSTAREFARQGAHVLLTARRLDRIDALARELTQEFGVKALTRSVDVMKNASVEEAFGSLPAEWQTIDILVNNAGLSRGLDKLHEGKLQDWEEMIDTNVKGLLYVTRVVLPAMVKRNSGHIINIGSIAGHQTYPNGNVYCASKFAVTALGRSLKMDLLGTAIRVTSVDPGLVDTEFSRVRFRDDMERASKTYVGMTPLTPDDIAEIVVFCASRPAHVNIGEVLVTPTDQATVSMVHRRT